MWSQKILKSLIKKLHHWLNWRRSRQEDPIVVFISVCQTSMWLARSCKETKPKISRTTSRLLRGFCCAARPRGLVAKLIVSCSLWLSVSFGT